MEVIVGVCTLVFVFITMCVVISMQASLTNKNIELINENINLTNENIELKENLKEFKHTVNLYSNISNKTLELHTLKSGYPSKLVDEHFDELI